MKNKKYGAPLLRGYNRYKRPKNSKYVSLIHRFPLRAKKKRPVWDPLGFFDVDDRGYIKGSYNKRGFFEPD